MILIKIKDNLINAEEILNINIFKVAINNGIELNVLFKNEKQIDIPMNDYEEANFYLEMIYELVNCAK